jgi:hypothetical protein
MALLTTTMPLEMPRPEEQAPPSPCARGRGAAARGTGCGGVSGRWPPARFLFCPLAAAVLATRGGCSRRLEDGRPQSQPGEQLHTTVQQVSAAGSEVQGGEAACTLAHSRCPLRRSHCSRAVLSPSCCLQIDRSTRQPAAFRVRTEREASNPTSSQSALYSSSRDDPRDCAVLAAGCGGGDLLRPRAAAGRHARIPLPEADGGRTDRQSHRVQPMGRILRSRSHRLLIRIPSSLLLFVPSCPCGRSSRSARTASVRSASRSAPSATVPKRSSRSKATSSRRSSGCRSADLNSTSKASLRCAQMPAQFR